MDRELFAAALRVLTSSLDGRRPATADVDLLRASPILPERDYGAEQLACSIIQRVTVERRMERLRVSDLVQ